MLQVVMARDHLLCGFDNGVDPSDDQTVVREIHFGSRPNVFFGPRRDALSLITRRVHSALILKPKQLKDLATNLLVLHLPGGDSATYEHWQKHCQQLNTKRHPVFSSTLLQSESELEADADIFHQVFRIDPQASLPELRLESFQIRISYLIEHNTLREHWSLEGIDAQVYDHWLVHWHQPEIDASEILQSTAFHEEESWLCSWRGQVFFRVQAVENQVPAAVAFAECGWIQSQRAAADRFHDVLEAMLVPDRTIGYNYVSHKPNNPWLGLESRSPNAIGRTDGMIVWQLKSQNWEVRYGLGQSLDKFPKGPWRRFDESLEAIRQVDRTWLAKQKAAPKYVPPQIQDLYKRTLLTLRQMQDPEGGIIAAPEFHFDFSHCGGYGFCWGRDAGFITLAMDICGMHEESARFYRYMARCQSEDGSFLHRHDMEGHLASSWGFLQPDETGSVLFGLWKHLELCDNRSLMNELQDMISKAADWLAAAKHPWDEELPIDGFDLWEEREGVHYYAVAAMAAGLKAAIDIYQRMGWQANASWQEQYEVLYRLTNSDRFIQKSSDKTHFARTLNRKIEGNTKQKLEARGQATKTLSRPSGRAEHFIAADYVVDISQIGTAYPYEILDLKRYQDVWKDYVHLIYDRLWRSGVGGIGRYEADDYRAGNPWILTTLWLALGASQIKQNDLARTCWQWVIQHVTPEGLFAEQIDPESGLPAWVMPLTWSHAMFVLAVHQLPEEVLS
ncbi:MAG: glycoside hydrolase family 15 protein [Oligoflexus sp.]